MSSVLRPVTKGKKGRTRGPVEIIRREDYSDLELDAKVELVYSHAACRTPREYNLIKREHLWRLRPDGAI